MQHTAASTATGVGLAGQFLIIAQQKFKEPPDWRRTSAGSRHEPVGVEDRFTTTGGESWR